MKISVQCTCICFSVYSKSAPLQKTNTNLDDTYRNVKYTFKLTRERSYNYCISSPIPKYLSHWHIPRPPNKPKKQKARISIKPCVVSPPKIQRTTSDLKSVREQLHVNVIPDDKLKLNKSEVSKTGNDIYDDKSNNNETKEMRSKASDHSTIPRESPDSGILSIAQC